MVNQFKRARLTKGVTQSEIAKQLGVTFVTVCRWETGKSFPSVKRLKAVANVLGVPVSDLISEKAG